MNPVGHQTLPIMPRQGGNMPRSQSSRGSAGQPGLGVSTGVGGIGVGQQHSVKRAQHQHAKHFITQTTKGSFTLYTASRINDLPEEILRDRLVQTSAHEDHRRRTIIIERDQSQGGSFGFTLQTYGIRHREVSEIELITYVDSVEPYGSAARAGMRAGDVILSINGQDVESVDHNRLIQMIQACGKAMRVVVLFEDCVRRVALHVKLMQLKRSYQQKILEYNHYVEAERNIIETLHNKGVNTEHLVKGSTELLPLTSSSQDVHFPFRKHSKSFNRLSVSHSKSESRLLSDSASNLATSSNRRPTHHRDTSASCSTLPRLGGRRNSARSLPASAAVTPVGSLDGLEQGSSDIMQSDEAPNFPPHLTPSLTASQLHNSGPQEFDDGVGPGNGEADTVRVMQEVLSVISDLLDRIGAASEIADVDNDEPNICLDKAELLVEQEFPMYESVYAKRGHRYSAAEAKPNHHSSPYHPLGRQPLSSGSLHSVDSGFGDRSLTTPQSCEIGLIASPFSFESLVNGADLSQKPDPDKPTGSFSISPNSLLSASPMPATLHDCVCRRLRHSDDADPCECGSSIRARPMQKSVADLDMTIRKWLCPAIAFVLELLALSVIGSMPLALLYAFYVLCLGM